MPMHPLPKLKMVLVTLLDVYPISKALSLTGGQWTSEWKFPLRAPVFAASIVVVLTWIVMPLLNRGLHRCLHPQARRASPSIVSTGLIA